MELSAKVNELLHIVNAVLIELGVSALPNNALFVVDPMSWTKMLKVRLRSNTPALCISVSEFGIEIDIDRILEAYCWSANRARYDPEKVQTVIKDILTSWIYVKRYGNHLTLMECFGATGARVRKIRAASGFSLWRSSDAHIYPPIVTSLRPPDLPPAE